MMAQLGEALKHVLCEVRCQLKLRAFGEEGLNAAPWSQEQWFEAFSFLFTNNGDPQAAHLKSHDDLLFFVHSKAAQVQAMPGLDRNGMPFSVRRRTHQLAPEWQKSGSNFTAIAWDETVLLNLALQTEYALSVVVCRQEMLPQVAAGTASPTQALSVTKRVFASPVTVTVNMDKPQARSTESETASCYPDVCFAVENFDDTFTDLVISDAEDCYCVIMHALLPEAGPPDPEQQSAESVGVGTTTAPALSQPASRPQRLVLFSGYVTHRQVAGHLQSRRSPFTKLLGAEDRRKVLMAGPGGMGHAEVAVKQQQQGSATNSPRKGPLQAVLGAFAAVFGEEPGPGSAAQASAASPGVPGEKLQCALMSLQLPVGKLALSLLDAML